MRRQVVPQVLTVEFDHFSGNRIFSGLAHSSFSGASLSRSWLVSVPHGAGVFVAILSITDEETMG